MHKFILEKVFWPLLSLILASVGYAEDMLVIVCPEIKWIGQRVGFETDGATYNEENAMSLKETVFIFDDLPPVKGGRVFSMYGKGDNPKVDEGKVTYVYLGDSPYVIVETQPYDIQEIYSFDLTTGRAILTNTKMRFGFYKDVYTAQCEINLLPSN